MVVKWRGGGEGRRKKLSPCWPRWERRGKRSEEHSTRKPFRRTFRSRDVDEGAEPTNRVSDYFYEVCTLLLYYRFTLVTASFSYIFFLFSRPHCLERFLGHFFSTFNDKNGRVLREDQAFFFNFFFFCSD